MKFSNIGALVKNDLRIFRTDRRAVIAGILVPIMIAAFFGYVFGGVGTTEVGKIPIIVVDEDQSAISKSIIDDLGRDSLVSVQQANRELALQRVKSGKTQVAAIIPKGFGDDSSRALFSSQQNKPKLEMLIDPSQAMSEQVIEGLFTQYGMQEITKSAFAGGGGEGAPGANPGGLRRGLTIPYEVSTTKVTSGSNIPYNGYAHSFAGMTVQFLLLAGVDAGVTLLLLRERGIWQRLRSAPLAKSDFLFAKTIATMLIGLFQIAVIYAAAILIFGVRITGSIPGFIAIAVAVCFLNSTFGLLLASVGRSPGATRGMAILVTLIMVMVGGAWVPSFIFPRWLQQASLIMPTRWAIDGLDAVTWRGLGFDAAMAPVMVLMGTAVICLAIAIYRFKWEE